METGRRRLLRPRVFVYPLLLCAVLTAFGFALAARSHVEVTFLRNQAARYSVTDSGEIRNQVYMKFTNKTDAQHAYDVELLTPGRIEENRQLPLTVPATESANIGIILFVPRSEFDRGRAVIRLAITDEHGMRVERTHKLSGPMFGGSPASTSSPPSSNDQAATGDAP
jgi:hypothetical protein